MPLVDREAVIRKAAPLVADVVWKAMTWQNIQTVQTCEELDEARKRLLAFIADTATSKE